MYYSAIGVLAVMILIIENHDILFRRNALLKLSAWGVYRRFLYAVLIYYITDILWGILESRRLAKWLFADTTIYFVAMAVGVLFWAEYMVAYLDDDSFFGRVLVYIGRGIAGMISLTTIINIFVPILFSIDGNCVYKALPVRYLMLDSQIIFLVLISVYAFSLVVSEKPKNSRKYHTLSLFGLIMGFFLFIQLYYPYLPIYSIAYMLGTCLLHTFVINNEKEEYRLELEKAYQRACSSGTIFTHLAMSLARGYTDLFYVNIDSGEFTEYYTDDEHGVLTESRKSRDFFESCKRDAKLYIHPEDQELFIKAMNRGFLSKVLEKDRVYELVYRRINGGDPFYVRMRVSRMEDDERFVVIGVTDIDEQVRQRKAEERIQEERIIYARLHALTGNFICIYIIDPVTDNYREFNPDSRYEDAFAVGESGTDFFNTVHKNAALCIYPPDMERFLESFSKENIMTQIEQGGIFTLGYRILMDGRPVYVQLKAAMVEEKEGRYLVLGLNNIDSQVRQEEEYEKRLAQAQNQVNKDALTGVKNKHAFIELESRMDQDIGEGCQKPFAIVALDLNDLKKVNDSEGHMAGDRYICNASMIICETFKRSPVFRVGGDEFIVISSGSDYEHMDELIAMMNEHNKKACRDGGVIIACGMSRFENDGSVSSVMERADQQMYQNKKYLKSVL